MLLYASAVYAVVMCPSVCLSVCLSVTYQYCIKMAKPRISQTTPHDSPGTLVFWCQILWISGSLGLQEFIGVPIKLTACGFRSHDLWVASRTPAPYHSILWARCSSCHLTNSIKECLKMHKTGTEPSVLQTVKIVAKHI